MKVVLSRAQQVNNHHMMQVSQMRFAVYYLSIYLSNETDNKKLQRILNNSQYNK